MQHAIMELAALLLALACTPWAVKRWMKTRELAGRVREFEAGLAATMPWLGIVAKGPVIAHRGDQPIFDWLDVVTRSGTAVRLMYTTEKASGESGEISLDAGAVRYIGHLPALSPEVLRTQRPASAMPRGFSLIELMVALVVSAVLLAVAIPLYNSYIEQSRLKSAQAALLQTANAVRQYAQDNGTYVGACGTPVAAADFQMSCPTLTPSAYLVEAQGTGVMTGFTFTVDQNGLQATPGVPAGWTTSASCWVADSSGDCAQG
ncbi:MAG: type IV pilin protein [Acidobacteriaceae bacterium]